MSSPPQRQKQRAEAEAGEPDGSVSAGSAAAAAAMPSSAPAAHLKLHRHALESICGFLSFDELRSAMLVSHRWLTAVSTMRGIAHGKTLTSINQIEAAKSSRLVRHVSVVGQKRVGSGHDRSPTLRLTRVLLRRVVSHMPFLRELHFEPQSENGWSIPMPFPSTLHTLSLHFRPTQSAASINSILAGFSQQQALGLTRLNLALIRQGPSESLPEGVSLSSLRSMAALETVELIDFSESLRKSLPLSELRALTQLSALEIKFCSPGILLQILQSPCDRPLQWTRLPTYAQLTDESAALLSTLPRLQTVSFSTRSSQLSSLAFLADLPALTELELWFKWNEENDEFEEEIYDRPILFASMPVLPRITSFHLGGSSLSPSELRGVLERLPNLRALWLTRMDEIDSFSFMQPVRATLRSFTFESCSHRALSSSSLHCLQALAQLTTLKVVRSFPLMDFAVGVLTPPSRLLPTLEQFAYEPPIAKEEKSEDEYESD